MFNGNLLDVSLEHFAREIYMFIYVMNKHGDNYKIVFTFTFYILLFRILFTGLVSLISLKIINIKFQFELFEFNHLHV